MRDAALYIALALAANAAGAGDLAELAVGELAGLEVHETPRDVPAAPVRTAGGEDAALPEGRPAVVNFWATWCAPCKEEMPSLARLHEAVGGDVAVVLVATGRNDPEAAAAFLAEVGASDLTDLRDPEGALGRAAAILGLPTTLVLDAQGREVARLQGIAEWDSAEALAFLDAVAGG